MAKQLEIDWVHVVENNRESQTHMEQNLSRFNAQCETVLNLLRQGIRLTCYDALTKYGIGHLPRRVKDLKEKGVDVQGKFVTTEDGKTRFKEYYLEAA